VRGSRLLRSGGKFRGGPAAVVADAHGSAPEFLLRSAFFAERAASVAAHVVGHPIGVFAANGRGLESGGLSELEEGLELRQIHGANFFAAADAHGIGFVESAGTAEDAHGAPARCGDITLNVMHRQPVIRTARAVRADRGRNECVRSVSAFR